MSGGGRVGDDRIDGLRRRLRDLYMQVGSPTFEQLSGAAAKVGRPMPDATASDLLNKTAAVPRWPTVEAFIVACQEHHRRSVSSADHTALLAHGAFDVVVWRTRYDAEAPSSARSGRRPRDDLSREDARDTITPAYWATVREVARRTPRLSGRQRDLQRIAAFATATSPSVASGEHGAPDPDTGSSVKAAAAGTKAGLARQGGDLGYRWLAALPWAGKTGLLAEAVCQWQARMLGQEREMAGEVDVVSYFPSRREADASSTGFLRVVTSQLAWLLGEPAPAPELATMRALWERAADRAAALGRHLLLVVDGLDEDLRPANTPSIAAVLPTRTGPNARVLVTSRPHPNLPSDIPAGHPLLGVDPIDLIPFAGSQKQQLLAMQEIDALVRQDGPLTDLLGLLAAAAGPLAVQDLAVLLHHPQPPTAAQTRTVRRLLTEQAARSLQPFARPGAAARGRDMTSGRERYQFAHLSLLEYAQAHPDLADPDYRDRLHAWVATWQARRWNDPHGEPLPRYLLDSYPATLASPAGAPATASRSRTPSAVRRADGVARLGDLVTDPGWIAAAVPVTGVDAVLAYLHTAAPGLQQEWQRDLARAVTAQAHHLRPPHPVENPAHTLRQLCLQALERNHRHLTDILRPLFAALPDSGWMPLSTTRHPCDALVAKVGQHFRASTLGVLPDGRIATAGYDGRVLMWDPTTPGAGPVQIGIQDPVLALVVLPDGRIATATATAVDGGGVPDGSLLVWDPATPGAPPVRVGKHPGVLALAVLPDGRIATASGGDDSCVLVWNPAAPGAGPVNVCAGESLSALAVLPDSRIVTASDSFSDIWVSAWDPAAPDAPPTRIGQHTGVLVMGVLPDGQLATLAGVEGQVLMWDPSAPGTAPVQVGQHTLASTLAVLPDGRIVTATGIGGDGRLLAWNPAATPGTASRNPVVLGAHARTSAAGVLSDGRIVTADGIGGEVLVWDLDRLTEDLPELEVHTRASALATLPDSRVIIATASGIGGHGSLLVWDPAAPAAAPVRVGEHAGVSSLVVLPDGRLVTSTSNQPVLVWDPATAPGTTLWTSALLGAHVRASVLGALPDGRIVTATGIGGDGRLLVWNSAATSDTALSSSVVLGVHPRVSALGVLPDGRIVTAGGVGGDSPVLVWDPAAPGEAPRRVGEHTMASALGVLPDGRIVTVSGAAFGDERVLVWDPDRPGTAAVRVGQHREASALAVLADGRIVTAGGGRVLISDPTGLTAPTEQVACTARSIATTATAAKGTLLVIAHMDHGWSLWQVPPDGVHRSGTLPSATD